MSAPRVLVVLPYAPATFMRADVEILQRHFRVDVVVHDAGKRALLRRILATLARDRPDVVLLWFAVPSYALPVTVAARASGAAVALVTGGYDVAWLPEIGYGAMRFRLFRLALRPTLALTDLTLPFSRSAAAETVRRARPRRWRVLYPGVDTAFFSPDEDDAREPLALTVSPVGAASIPQKGLATFVEAARLAPTLRFVVVGRLLDAAAERLRAAAPANVEFVDRFVTPEELRDLYRLASCYVQASAHEGFGLAVAEAMACGAVPVVTELFSLPEVTGGLGEYVSLGDPAAVAAAAVRSLRATPRDRELLRRRVASQYPLERRERELVVAVRALAELAGPLSPRSL